MIDGLLLKSNTAGLSLFESVRQVTSTNTDLGGNDRLIADRGDDIVIGGFGGDGAISGDVIVKHEGTINTAGNYTHGIMAQSIGGGGGNGAHRIATKHGDRFDIGLNPGAAARIGTGNA